MTRTARAVGAILAASLPMFMVSLNNLVVTNALPEIGRELSAADVTEMRWLASFDVLRVTELLPRVDGDLAANVTDLQWVVNAYILAFAGLLLTGAALGDRYGRRRVFLAGIVVFSAGSIACALAGSIPFLIAARVLQGIGAAAVQPLSLTLVAGSVPENKRNAAIGLWGGVNGLGVALGPLVGGAVTEGIAWQWIFWINVPIALLAVPFVVRMFPESRGRDRGLDLRGMLLATGATTVTVWAIVRASDDGWTSPLILTAFAVAIALFTLFVRWERRASAPLLPLRFYRSPSFVLSNLVSLAMFFGVFGSIFFLVQYIQGPLQYSPLEAGLRTLPWTAMPMIVTPLVGLIIDRVGGGRLMAAGMALQAVALAWLALVVKVDSSYGQLVPAMVLAGTGMGLVFAPTMAVVLGSVRQHEHGKASGANNTIREVGGALGIAVLTTVFSAHFNSEPHDSPIRTGELFVEGMVAAMWVGVAVVTVGAVIGSLIKRPGRSVENQLIGDADTGATDEDLPVSQGSRG